MKKRAMLLFFTSVLCMAFAVGCGRGKQDNADGSHQTAQDTQQGGEIDSTGTESAADSETTSQLQLGNAVEIPESFDGELAETEAHPQLEKAIAEYSGIAEEDYGNVRYYRAGALRSDNESQNQFTGDNDWRRCERFYFRLLRNQEFFGRSAWSIDISKLYWAGCAHEQFLSGNCRQPGGSSCSVCHSFYPL